MRRVGVLFVLTALLAPISARADGAMVAGADVYRCAFAKGAVPGGHAEVYACAEYGSRSWAFLRGTALPFTHLGYPQTVMGSITVTTRTGTDVGTFAFDPTDPDSARLSAFSMDPRMDSATLVLHAGTTWANVSLQAGSETDPEEWAGADPGSTQYPCAAQWAGFDLWRPGSVASSSRIGSTRIGGGALTQASGEMFQGLEQFAMASYYPEPKTYLLCV